MSPLKSLIKLFQDIMIYGLERLGRYYSIYRAFVIDNNDPLKLGRLKLKIPDIYGQQVYEYWVPARNVFSGNKFGVKLIPPKNELVWVEFELGDAKRPVWSHGYWGKDDLPDNPDLSNIDNYWFLSPKGHLIEVDDSRDLIRVTSNKGRVIEISDSISLGSKTQSSEPGVLGNKNEYALKELASKLDTIYNAISAAPTASADGGAAFKAGITTTLSSSGFPISASFNNIANATKSSKLTLD